MEIRYAKPSITISITERGVKPGDYKMSIKFNTIVIADYLEIFSSY